MRAALFFIALAISDVAKNDLNMITVAIIMITFFAMDIYELVKN